MMGCNVLSPQIFWFRKMRRSLTVTFFMSILINIGMWFERFVIIVTSVYRDYLPSSWSTYYSPTIWEVGFYMGTFGLFFTCYFLFAKPRFRDPAAHLVLGARRRQVGQECLARGKDNVSYRICIGPPRTAQLSRHA